MSRTHIIEIEVEDNDGARTTSELARLAAGAAEFMQNALPDELDVTGVRCTTQSYEDPPAFNAGVVVTQVDAPVPFDGPVSQDATMDAEDDPDNPTGYPGHGG